MKSKVILITGASSGMGKVTAEKLISEGHIVYPAARRIERMDDLKEMGGHPLALDITKEEDVVSVVKRIMDEQGRIDVLWNNAGYGLYGAVEDVPMEKIRYQFDVNFFGLVRMTKEVLPHMRAQGSGTIINTSSMGGKMYTPLGAFYHGTKHALEGWSDCLRLELKQHGINVVILEPGIIKTEFADVMSDGLLDQAKDGAYEDLTRKVAEASLKAYEQGQGTPASEIAEVVSKIVNTNKPNTRYVKGYLAKPFMWVRKNLGDRVFDKAVMSQF